MFFVSLIIVKYRLQTIFICLYGKEDNKNHLKPTCCCTGDTEISIACILNVFLDT